MDKQSWECLLVFGFSLNLFALMLSAIMNNDCFLFLFLVLMVAHFVLLIPHNETSINNKSKERI